jgi:hypothetical protein
VRCLCLLSNCRILIWNDANTPRESVALEYKTFNLHPPRNKSRRSLKIETLYTRRCRKVAHAVRTCYGTIFKCDVNVHMAYWTHYSPIARNVLWTPYSYRIYPAPCVSLCLCSYVCVCTLWAKKSTHIRAASRFNKILLHRIQVRVFLPRGNVK